MPEVQGRAGHCLDAVGEVLRCGRTADPHPYRRTCRAVISDLLERSYR
jgi:hypothetical protein